MKYSGAVVAILVLAGVVARLVGIAAPRSRLGRICNGIAVVIALALQSVSNQSIRLGKWLATKRPKKGSNHVASRR